MKQIYVSLSARNAASKLKMQNFHCKISFGIVMQMLTNS